MKQYKSLDIGLVRPNKWIAHEALICILDKIKSKTDYCYCLVHLLDESKEYRDYFYNLPASRVIILDCSVFELGEAFEGEKYEYFINELKPSVFIAPDVLGNKERSIENAKVWKQKKLPYSMMAVVQGQNMDELIESYKEYEKMGVDAIALGFNHNFFIESSETADWDQANGRIKLVKELKNKGIWSSEIYHHLLGCTLPFEFAHAIYKDINSLDTSSPVLHGLLGIKYNELSLLNKRKIKVNELMYKTVYPEQWELIIENIAKFKQIIK